MEKKLTEIAQDLAEIGRLVRSNRLESQEAAKMVYIAGRLPDLLVIGADGWYHGPLEDDVVIERLAFPVVFDLGPDALFNIGSDAFVQIGKLRRAPVQEDSRLWLGWFGMRRELVENLVSGERNGEANDENDH